MRSSKSLIVVVGCAGFVLLANVSLAQATVCKDDGDCAKDEHCIKTPCAVPSCEPGMDCAEPSCPDEGSCEANGPGSTCTGDDNCPSGFVCEVVGASSCASPGCEPGKACPPPPPCETEEISACVPAPCEDDAACGDGLSCVTFTYETCDDMPVSCASGQDCEKVEPVPPSCETTSRSMCAPPYIAPCEVDADCGDGFDCKPRQECMCSGGGASTPQPTDPDTDPDGGAADELPPPEETQCSCTDSGENYCAPKEIACEAAADCPDNWSCVQAPTNATDCAEPPPGSDEKSQCLPPTTTDPVSYCVPPAWDTWGGSSSGSADGVNYGEALSKATGADSNAEIDVTRSPASPEEPAAEPADRGCSITGSSSGLLLVLLALLALRLVLRRRRHDER